MVSRERVIHRQWRCGLALGPGKKSVQLRDGNIGMYDDKRKMRLVVGF